jgi:hypothetical protein
MNRRQRRSVGERVEAGSAPGGDDDGTKERTSAVAEPRQIDFTIVPSQVLHILFAVITLLVGLSTAGQVIVYYAPDFPLRDAIANLFYVDFERSLPTLYSSVVLFIGALLLATIAHAHRRRRQPYARHWAAVALVFFLLALDEFAAFHELAIGPLRALLDIKGGPLWFAWVVPAAVAVVVFVIAFARFLGHLSRPTRHRMVAAGLLFVGGAIGVELISGSYSALHGKLDFTYALIATVEETLEMLGSAVLLYALLAYVPVRLPDVAWRLRIAASE